MGALPYGPPFSDGIQAEGCAAHAEAGVSDRLNFPIEICIPLSAYHGKTLLALGLALASCVRLHQFSVVFP